MPGKAESEAAGPRLAPSHDAAQWVARSVALGDAGSGAGLWHDARVRSAPARWCAAAARRLAAGPAQQPAARVGDEHAPERLTLTSEEAAILFAYIPPVGDGTGDATPVRGGRAS
jgi:hypothetical protein